MNNPVNTLGEETITRILQKKEMKMLCDLKKILDKNGITFFLACGTALGCARHSGFIPWDDDIDIYIRGKDYEKLRSVFSSQNTGNLQFQDYSTVKGYPYTFPKIVSDDTVLCEESIKHLDYNCGVYIDVFPIYGVTDNKMLRIVKEKVRYLRYAILKAYYFNYSSGIRGILSKVVHLVVNPYKIQERLAHTYMSDSDGKTVMIEPGVFGTAALLQSKQFEDVILMKFEGEMMPMPIGYKEYLTEYYGNYMELPPENQRVARHHISRLCIPDEPLLDE